MERRRPRNKQQAQCGADRSRRARRVRGAAAPRPRLPIHRPGASTSGGSSAGSGGSADGGTAAASQTNSATGPAAQVPEEPPMRCAFGATRAGGLLGRLRLHLQTERFLAVRRDDAMWEAACLLASVALGDLVAALSEDEMQAPLSGPAQPAVCSSAPSGNRPSGSPGGVVPSIAPYSEGAR